MHAKGPPQGSGAPVHRVVKAVKQNWWLWGAVAFAFVLITGVVMFRHKLYNTGNFGLPFLAGELPMICATCCTAQLTMQKAKRLHGCAPQFRKYQFWCKCFSITYLWSPTSTLTDVLPCVDAQ